MLVGPPAQAKHHQTHPGVLNQGYLVINVQVPETYKHFEQKQSQKSCEQCKKICRKLKQDTDMFP